MKFSKVYLEKVPWSVDETVRVLGDLVASEKSITERGSSSTSEKASGMVSCATAATLLF